ncbi:proclotting enzyme-like [Artemia franciscana]|uniref:proclotting enzyme-like n=1 Tax=Artemia franciscana TaxID=6661 RepID=UPI0032DAA735
MNYYTIPHARQTMFDTSQFSVELGRTNLITGDTSKMQSYKVKEVRVHPNFRAHGFYNDVAIFTLDGKAKYTDYVRPVCLPSTEDDEFSLVGEIPTVTGFGATDYAKQMATLLESLLNIPREVRPIRKKIVVRLAARPC